MAKNESGYRVLARRYRPKNFDALVGQEVLVQTLSNAIAQDRVAHAFMLTGIRGVGKTTTARIIARTLNCVGKDGDGGMTANPCGECEPCVSILGDCHIDVMEMDAASRTGVDDIRELIESVPYKPVSARYKVYIIDEVHMLSKNAFNALLKTLEEPPAHVKFIFATTEIRKVPVTILSRCQRFDLKRLGSGELANYLCEIAEKESVELAPEAAAQMSSASGGSARDALSLLDQAIASIGKKIDDAAVREMLGTVDKRSIAALFNLFMAGKAIEMLAQFEKMYHDGADPHLLLQDLMDFTHLVTKAKVAPEYTEKDSTLSDGEKAAIREAAGELSMASLARTWQMLLKGVQEVASADRPDLAVEMLLIRMAHVAEMPTPIELVTAAKKKASSSLTEALPQTTEEEVPTGPTTFEEAVELANSHKEMLLAERLRRYVKPVDFSPGKIVCALLEDAPKDLLGIFSKKLKTWTGQSWEIETALNSDAKTLYEEVAEKEDALKLTLGGHPVVKEIQQMFPGAEIGDMIEKKAS